MSSKLLEMRSFKTECSSPSQRLIVRYLAYHDEPVINLIQPNDCLRWVHQAKFPKDAPEQFIRERWPFPIQLVSEMVICGADDAVERALRESQRANPHSRVIACSYQIRTNSMYNDGFGFINKLKLVVTDSVRSIRVDAIELLELRQQVDILKKELEEARDMFALMSCPLLTAQITGDEIENRRAIELGEDNEARRLWARARKLNDAANMAALAQQLGGELMFDV